MCGKRVIVVNGILFDRYPIADGQRERLALVRLLQTGLISESLLGLRWGVGRNTLGRWRRRFESEGLEGLRRGALTARVPAAAGVSPQLRLLAEETTGPAEAAVAAGAEAMAEGAVSAPPLGVMVGGQQVVEATPVDATSTPPEPIVVTEVPSGALWSRYAGLSLALGALQQLLAPVLASLAGVGGHSARMLYALVVYLLAGFKNPEQTKAACRREMGVLLGARALPEVHALRRHLPALTAADLPGRLAVALARRYLDLGWVVPCAWLIDGHFCPYYGKEKLAKGWSPLRRLAMAGHHQVWVHDGRGRPLIVRITQAFELFADTLPVIAGAVQRLLDEAGRHQEPMVVVFDRGGYAGAVFRALNQMGIGWITWLKRKIQLPATEFTRTTEIHYQRQAPQQVFFAETHVAIPGCHEAVYAVVWHEGDPEHQVALISNLDQRAPGQWSPERLIEAMVRWAQENAFKESKAHVGLDWPDGYQIAPMDETVQVPNPERRQLQRRLADLAEREKRWRLRGQTAKTQRAREKALAHCRGILSAITRLSNRLDALPETVAYASLNRPAKAWLRTERALLVATLRAAAFHLRAQLLEAIETVFADYRERTKCLQVLMEDGGWFVPGRTVDTYILKAPETPRYRTAAMALCGRLNTLAIPSPGRPGRCLRWQVYCPRPPAPTS